MKSTFNRAIKILAMIFFLITNYPFIGCDYNRASRKEDQYFTNQLQRDSVFKIIDEFSRQIGIQLLATDSLGILILPVQASCPSCRKKAIDSISANKDNLGGNSIIIISASGGKKLIGSYFSEQGLVLPMIPGKLFLDTTNLANRHKLYDGKPTFYYLANKEVFKKVASVPKTVKEDLRYFFNSQK